MKTFRFIGMALFAVLLSVNFASCGGDNEPFEEEKEEDVVASKKKLIEMTWENKYGTLSYKFTYDSKGQLSQLECGTIEEDGEVTYQGKYKYDWSNNLITISSNELPDFKCTCKLENGLITDIDIMNYLTYKYTFNYDESQKMIEFNSNKTRNAYIWGENSLIKFSQFTTDNIEIESTINYQNYLNNYGWLDFDLECLNMSSLPIYIRCLVISNSELLGKHFFSNLPKKITTELYSKFWDFTFKLDEDGYVQQCKVSDHYKNNDNYTYKWQ